MADDNAHNTNHNNGVDAGKTADSNGHVTDKQQNGGAAVLDVTMEGNGTVTKEEKPLKEANGEAAGKDGDDKEKKEEEYDSFVGVLELFRFATAWDWFLLFWGTVWAVANGVAFPLVLLFFGDVTDAFIGFGQAEAIEEGLAVTLPPSATTAAPVDPAVLFAQVSEDIQQFAINYSILGVGVLVASYFQTMLWSMAAVRQIQKIRLLFFHSVLRQEIGWFDTHQSGEMNTRMNEDIDKIRDGFGDKIGIVIQWLTTAVGGFVLGFIYSWKLTLVILATSPLIAIAAGAMAQLVQSSTKEELDAYAKAGSIAEEVLSAIRTVVAFGGEHVETERYASNLHHAKSKAIKRNIMQGGSLGAVYAIMYGSYGLAFWYGTKLYLDDEISPGEILIVFFGVLFGAFSLGNAAPHIAIFQTARGAASAIWEVIDQIPTIDSSSDAGMQPKELTGQITFENVHFAYPSRKDVKVLNGLNLDVNVGQTVALVGSSGCGKSTVVNLVQRFYDADEGSVKLDGNNLKDLNVTWLREHIGIVSQEPVLFATTIAENIRYGRLDVTNEEMVAAAKEANAHDFIDALPDKYETLVGERGAQLSGGQKQRVAIARALVRNPRILLLDEATSALDTESEGVVQAALDKVQTGRTTIAIAHRLSTIRNADVICAFQEGVIVEKGSHDELMALPEGIYKGLVNMQSRKEQATETKEEETDEEALSDSEDEQENNGQSPPGESGECLLPGRPVSDPGHVKVEADPLVDNKSPERKISRKDSGRGSHRKLKRGMSAMSATSDVEEKEDDFDEKKHFSFSRLMKMNASEWPYMVLGFLGAAVNGGMQPCFAIVFARVIGTYALPIDEIPDRVRLFSILFVVIGVVIFFSSLLQGYGLGKSGEELTQRLRQASFKAMLRQEISWFDDHKNSTGALTTRLATEASQVQGATGARIGTMISAVFNLGTGIIISFYYGWALTLLVLAFLPLTVVASAIQWKLMDGSAEEDKATKESAGKVAVEAIVNVRTVASLTREKSFFANFKQTLDGPYKGNIRKSHLAGIAYGSSQCIMFFAYAAAFRLGGYLVEQGQMEFDDVFLVFSAIVFGGFALGGATALAPDYSKAVSSAAHLLYLLDRVPEIDTYSTEGHKPDDYKASVKFETVKFRYPTRPDIPVLRGLTVSVNPGETLALVGSSGCGKSTSVSLVERFYNAKSGEVLLDTYDMKVLNISWLRSQIGLVSQEPILFDRTIGENIAYGDNTRKVEMEEIIDCAKKANIHDFIDKLPQGYETKVGDKGTQLSGGQKQRVAIARALLRNPRILLLDEATSALDSESERIVQAALDEAKKGRTCITIAHRLSTIHDAEKIAVIRHGRVDELGTHDELIKLKGQYHKLYTAQEMQQSE